ncbi:N-acetylneuraminate synthase family protein [Prochlorococcus sp. AH-736-E15]|nr:N-acetylneuraminate synthase family protein [Prochlorococcus sp. AH-736-E15]
MDYPEFKIGNRAVGYNHEPLVIAELGINHGGDLAVAKKMVDSAISGGAELIKHQTHVVTDEMSSLAKKTIPGNSNKNIYQIMEECSLNEEEEFELFHYVKSKNCIFLSTPFSREAALRLERFNLQAYKIGSGECNNYPLIELIASFGKPIILSTGMNTISDVAKSVEILEKHKVKYALLHTTNIYPTPPQLVRLNSLRELAKAFPKAVIGLSDHTNSNHACFGAVALGASILERHFTDNFDRKGPDICCSMDASQLSELIKGASLLKKMRGGTKSELLIEEEVTREFAFATVVAIKDISTGEQFTKKNIWVKRPGIGEIPAEEFRNIIGKVASADIAGDSHISWKQVAK